MKERPVRGLSKRKTTFISFTLSYKKKTFYVNGLKYNFYVN